MGQSIYQLQLLFTFFITCFQFSERIRKADMKYGNKNLIIDENRRDTYKQFHPSTYAYESSLLSNFGGERKQLLAVCSQCFYIFQFAATVTVVN